MRTRRTIKAHFNLNKAILVTSYTSKAGANLPPLSLLKKSILPAYAGFEITFLPRVSRGKKHFYPHKCVRDAALTQPCAQCGCPVGKPPYGGFSTVSAAPIAFMGAASVYFLSLIISCIAAASLAQSSSERTTCLLLINSPQYGQGAPVCACTEVNGTSLPQLGHFFVTPITQAPCSPCPLPPF